MIKLKTSIPGNKSLVVLNKLKKLNIGYNDPYPFVHSKKGNGCYFEDLDGNVFLDFASQVASNPLGYNNKDLKKVVKKYSKNFPVKYAGQDFSVEEQVKLLEELTSVTPKEMNMAFLVNSGAEAVENCLKIAMRKQKHSKFGIAFHKSFHGRTLGGLSCTDSKKVQKKSFLHIPVRHYDYHENSLEKLEKLMKRYSSKDVGFVIIEAVQGEGGYNFASKKLIQGLRKFTSKYNIPFIIDEVQSGMGRTGKWWSFQHYNVKPDIFSSAKALQVGAAITSNKYKVETGTISSTWGGGSLLDMAIGLETIKIIKKKNLLRNVNNMGNYLIKRLNEINLSNVRGKGLMIAFDLKNENERNNFVIECLKNGLVILGAGKKSVRIIPPYIVSKKEIDEAIDILEATNLKIKKPKFKHAGKICDYINCGGNNT